MATTNKTPHYNLPQWVGTDITSWMGDLNPAFSTIDTNIFTAVSSAANAQRIASNASTTANSVASDVTANTNSINKLNTNVDVLTQQVNAVVQKTDNLVSYNAPIELMTLGSYLSNFNPSISGSNSAKYRTFNIGGLIGVNVYSLTQIIWTGSPTINDISRVADLNVNQAFQQYVNVFGNRSIFNFGTISYETTNGWFNAPFDYNSQNNSFSLRERMTGTLGATKRVNIIFQGVYFLGMQNT